MALQNTLSGMYLKIIPHLCTVTPSSVQVSFYAFQSREDRDEYFNRRDEILTFLSACETKISLLKNLLREGDCSAIMSKLSAFEEDVSFIRSRWEFVSFPKFRSQELLNECGFNEMWCTPLKPWSILTVHTGKFVGQKTSLDGLYSELKRVYKNNFVDC